MFNLIGDVPAISVRSRQKRYVPAMMTGAKSGGLQLHPPPTRSTDIPIKMGERLALALPLGLSNVTTSVNQLTQTYKHIDQTATVPGHTRLKLRRCTEMGDDVHRWKNLPDFQRY